MSSQNRLKYKPYLVHFLSFLDGKQYKISDDFNVDRLLQITDKDVVRYFNFISYGVAEPTAKDRPTKMRSTSLLYAKKSISYFMPRPGPQWDIINGTGNPTKAQSVNKMIELVKTYEVRGEGVPSQARRAIEYREFLLLLVLVRKIYSGRSLLPAILGVLCVQWQLIGRIDDVMQLGKSTLSHDLRFSDVLLVQMRWSKNIREERDSPVQMLFGSMDPLICPILNLGVFLEVGGGDSNSSKLFGGRSNQSVSFILDKIFKSNLFIRSKAGPLGTHSIRKGAATYASRNGLMKDWVSTRGRWKGKKRQVDNYIDIDLPYPDATCAEILCGELGACKYVVKDGLGLSDEVIGQLVPNICDSFSLPVARIFAMAILWAAYTGDVTRDNYTFSLLPSHLCNNVREKFKVLRSSNCENNPIKRVRVTVRQRGDQLVIIDVDSSAQSAKSEHNPVTEAYMESTLITDSSQQVMVAQMCQLHQKVEDLRQEVAAMSQVLQRNHRIVCGTLKRIAIQPVIRPAGLIRVSYFYYLLSH